MSSLQVDSISSMGGGHVDGAGKVVQFKEAVTGTETTIANNTTAIILTLDFTPKFSDSIILCQAVHNQDACGSDAANNNCNSRIHAGATNVTKTGAIGYKIEKLAGARFTYSYSGPIASWGTTPLEIRLEVQADSGNWVVSQNGRKTSLLVWELAQ